MTNEKKSSGIQPRHKLLVLCISVLVLPLLATAGWYWGADKLRTIVENKIQTFANEGKTLTCNNLDIIGYPFRIGIQCTHTAFDDNRQRTGLTAGELRTAAQIYNPGHIIAELDGPLQLSNKDNELEITWQNLRASSKLDLSAISRLSIEATNMQVKVIRSPMANIGNIHADNVQTHVRQNGNDLDIATSASTLGFHDNEGQALAANSHLAIMATVFDKANALDHDQNGRGLDLKGASLQLKQFQLVNDNQTEISASGPMSFTKDGLLNAQIDLNVKNLANALDLLTKQNPEMAANLAQFRTVLTGLNAPNNDNSIQIKLNVRDGVVSAGLLPLGIIPAI